MPRNFENLDAFRNATDLSVALYKATANFPDDERYGLTAQLRRAAISVISNIAEGQGRLTKREWLQFLGHARGSLFEIQAQLLVANRLGLLDDSAHDQLRSEVVRTAGPLAGLIRYVRHAR